MNAYYLHYTDNANSWNRIYKLFGLYWPLLKPNYIFCTFYTFAVCVFIAGVMTNVEVPLDILLNIIVTAKVCTCPIMLAKRDYRDLSAQLPARAAEKLGFLLLTFLILFPSIIYGSLYLGQIVGNALFGIYIPIELLCIPTGVDVFGSSVWSSTALGSANAINLLLIASIIVVTLYYVVKAKRERTLSGIMGFGAMYLFIIVLLIGWKAFFSKFIFFPTTVELALSITTYAAKATLVVVGTIGIFYLVKLYKLLKYSGF